MEEIKERQAAKKKNHNAATVKEKVKPKENVRAVKKQVKEIPAIKVEKEADTEKIPEKCESCNTVKRHNNKLIHNMKRLKESYDVLNKAMNQYSKSSNEQEIAMKTLNGAFMTKQKIINQYIEKCAELEQKLETQWIETERVNRLLKSYSCASYVIDRIYPTVEGMEAFEEKTSEVKNTGKKHSTNYTRCPPPLEEGYSPRNPNSERVKKATNLKWESEPSDGLPDNIDITFTTSDTDHESELIKKVVDQVLDKDEESKSESKSENSNSSDKSSSTPVKRAYNNDFLISKNNLNDETFKVAYTLNDSDKLYSGEEFPIRSVKTEMINKTDKEFLAKKQGGMKKDVAQKKEKRTCYQCKKVGHIAWNCPKATQTKQGVSANLKEKLVDNEPPTEQFKVFKNSTFEVGESSTRFYKRRVNLNNHKWVGKKSEALSGDEPDSSKSEEPPVELKSDNSVPKMDDANFPPLSNGNLKQKIGKVEISNQFFSEKKEFDVETAFNSKVLNIFGKMFDRKVKGVKKFYEKNKKGKKPSDDDSESPKDCQAWVNLFN
ncbi:putative transcription factor interactor and regulator CCHC(Zn) family [Helianthus annuus]|nr:putative transcription factor interactor and regulator CCHC(Zn) family [Helianthus annuus]